jgi:hypothetical protein
MAIKYIKWPYAIYSKRPQNVPTVSISRPSKIYPNWDFLFPNIPSGNRAQQQQQRKLIPNCRRLCQLAATQIFSVPFFTVPYLKKEWRGIFFFKNKQLIVRQTAKTLFFLKSLGSRQRGVEMKNG